jgi:DNA polymerase (family 10)
LRRKQLLLYKGFGAKTQHNIQESIRFFTACQGSYLYSQIEKYAESFTERMQLNFPEKKFMLTGDFNRI